MDMVDNGCFDLTNIQVPQPECGSHASFKVELPKVRRLLGFSLCITWFLVLMFYNVQTTHLRLVGKI